MEMNDGSSKKEITTVSDIVGNWGPWQFRIFISFTLVYFTNPFLNNGIIFFAPRIDFWCKTPDGVKNQSTFRQCQRYDNHSVPCKEWSYDNSVFASTAVDEFDLVCDRAWMISASTSAFQFGYALSAFATGYISDTYGRLFTLKLCALCEIVSGLFQVFALNMWHFLASRLLLGVFACGKFLSGFVLLLEAVSPQNRAQMSCVLEVGWYLGSLMLAGSAYVSPDFRYLQLFASTFSLFAVGTLWMSTESPRWLIVNGKLEEAEKIVLVAAKQKARTTSAEVHQKFIALTHCLRSTENTTETASKQSYLNLWRVPILLKYSVVLYALWYIGGLVRYSLVINMGELGGNIFVNHTMFTVTGAIGTVIQYFLLPRVNRRKMYFFSMMLGALALFAIVPYVGSKEDAVKCIAFASVGKFFLSFGYQLNYLQASEIFPTSFRQLAVGSCSLCARLGSIMSPFTKEFADFTHPAASMITFGLLAMLGGFLDLILPESRTTEIPDTISDVILMYKKKDHSELEYVPVADDKL